MDIIARRPYLSLIPGIFPYPFNSGASIGVIVAGSIFFALGFFVAGIAGILGTPMLLILAGAEVGYFFHVMQHSGSGAQDAPGWPDVAHWVDYLGDLLQWIMAFVAAFLPAVTVFLGMVGFGAPIRTLPAGTLGLLIGALFFGASYFPMALMLSGFGNSWSAPFHYIHGLRSIFRLGIDYALCAIFFGITYAIQTAGVAGIDSLSPGLLKIPGQIAAMALILTTGMMQMRALGLLYFARDEDLAWFR